MAGNDWFMVIVDPRFQLSAWPTFPAKKTGAIERISDPVFLVL